MTWGGFILLLIVSPVTIPFSIVIGSAFILSRTSGHPSRATPKTIWLARVAAALSWLVSSFVLVAALLIVRSLIS